jgi:hypothetical protein
VKLIGGLASDRIFGLTLGAIILWGAGEVDIVRVGIFEFVMELKNILSMRALS